MPTIIIPDRYAPGLAKIIRLSEAEAERVAGVLGDASTGNRSEIVKLISPILPSLNQDDLRTMADALLSLYKVRTGLDFSVETFVKHLLTAIKQSDNEAIRQADESEIGRLAKTLAMLLSVRPLSVMSKARELQTDFPNTFCDAKVITDMRPVFDVDVKTDPIGAVITHTLKIEYHNRSNNHVEMHIALDKDDVERLMTVLRRAQDKAVTLGGMAAKTGLQILAQ